MVLWTVPTAQPTRAAIRTMRGQFLGLGFPFGVKWFGHDDLLPEYSPNVTQSYTELNTVPTNFRNSYPLRGSLPKSCCNPHPAAVSSG